MEKTNRQIALHKFGDKAFDVMNIILFGCFAFICAYPFYYIIINSMSDNTLVSMYAVKLYPKGIQFENYKNLIKMNGIGAATLTSIARTVLGTIIPLVSSSVLGYAMSRKELWHRKFWYRFLVITMYFGAGLIPGYMNMKRLGLLNSFWVYVVPSLVSPYNMILVKTYIEGIPESLEEAAIMDGGGYFVRYLKIILPLSKPVLATIAIFCAVGQWNAYMDTILYMTGSKHQTLQSTLYVYMRKSQLLANALKNGMTILDAEDLAKIMTPLSARYTMTAVVALPVIMIYPIFQKYFTKGIMIGAVKG